MNLLYSRIEKLPFQLADIAVYVELNLLCTEKILPQWLPKRIIDRLYNCCFTKNMFESLYNSL